jgi:hypothetical protein
MRVWCRKTKSVSHKALVFSLWNMFDSKLVIISSSLSVQYVHPCMPEVLFVKNVDKNVSSPHLFPIYNYKASFLVNMFVSNLWLTYSSTNVIAFLSDRQREI